MVRQLHNCMFKPLIPQCGRLSASFSNRAANHPAVGAPSEQTRVREPPQNMAHNKAMAGFLVACAIVLLTTSVSG